MAVFAACAPGACPLPRALPPLVVPRLRALGRTAVSMVFDRWAKRSGLPIPFYGAHCLRHAYAVHLLHTGASLKTIGDLLGHRDSDSTYVYLRLATEELRDVALPVPTLPTHPQPSERAP